MRLIILADREMIEEKANDMLLESRDSHGREKCQRYVVGMVLPTQHRICREACASNADFDQM